MITLCLGEITVNREDFGDKFIANYICQFYDAVATSNQNECLCRNNGTFILLKNGSINCYYETKSFAGMTQLFITFTGTSEAFFPKS